MGARTSDLSLPSLAVPEPLLLMRILNSFYILDNKIAVRKPKKMMDADSKWEVISLLVHDHISLKLSPPSSSFVMFYKYVRSSLLPIS